MYIKTHTHSHTHWYCAYAFPFQIKNYSVRCRQSFVLMFCAIGTNKWFRPEIAIFHETAKHLISRMSARKFTARICLSLQWRHNGCLKSPAFRLFTQAFVQAQIKENIKAPRHRPLCEEFSGEFPAQRASKAENVFIWWRHHAMCLQMSYHLTMLGLQQARCSKPDLTTSF